MGEINVLFGKKVRRYRVERGLSQTELATNCGLHRTYIGQIERAEKNITLKNIEKIADCFDVKITDLLDLEKLKV